jgi:hypothetical protein
MASDGVMSAGVPKGTKNISPGIIFLEKVAEEIRNGDIFEI